MATSVQARQAGNATKKLARLPKSAKVSKRPLLRPHIPSPYTGPQNQKVVYVSTKTPFMSAVKRVKKLLGHINDRAVQSELSYQHKARSKRQPAVLASANTSAAESVIIKATGKAINNALNLALFFQGQNDLDVKIKTGTVAAIDDIEAHRDPLVDLEDCILDSGQQGEGTKHQDTPMAEASNKDEPQDVDDLPSSRIRQMSCIEIFVTLR